MGTDPTLLAMLLAALAAGLAVPPAPARRLDALAPASVRPPRTVARLPVLATVVAGCAVAATALLGTSTGVLVGATGTVVAVVAEIVLARRAERTRARRRADVARAARVLAGQLRIGQVPTEALRATAADCPPLQRAAATLAIGGDVATALREAGSVPGQEGLVTLALAWEVSERSGAPVSDLAVRVAQTLRAQHETRSQVDAELAGPRASGRLLACLPLVGLGLCAVSGGDPQHFLLHTTPGQLCLLLGAVLAGAGALWNEKLADRALR